VILRAAHERNDLEKFLEFVAFESACERYFTNAIFEECPWKRVGDFLRLVEDVDVAPRELGIGDLQRNGGRFIPHGGERGAKIRDCPDVLRVVTWVHLMRTHGLVELPKQISDNRRVEGRFDRLASLVRVGGHREKMYRRAAETAPGEKLAGGDDDVATRAFSREEAIIGYLEQLEDAGAVVGPRGDTC
jgi:hypothetical protein